MRKVLKVVSTVLLVCIFVVFAAKIYVSKYKKNDSIANTSLKYTKINGKDAKKIMEENKDYILLDVRTEEEYKENRIDGAILIPDFEIDYRAKEELPNKEEIILIYCRSGRRSAQVAQKLSQLGYKNIYDFGGINDWPYETVNN